MSAPERPHARSSPARAAWGYIWRYRARYGFGIACLGTATYASLTIPWTVKRAIDALQADAAAAPMGYLVGLIVLSALVNGVARLGSRFAITGGCQHIESEIRGELFAALQSFPPRFYATHSTGDLMARSTSDITAVRSLLGFGTISLVSTTFSFVGVLAAMLAVDPWLTLWSLAPSPVLVVLARRFNLKVNERAQAAQDQLSVLSERVQEYVAGMAVVRAYTLEPRARADFGQANAEYLRRSLALARTEAGFSPLMGLIAGIGTLIVLWAGGRAVVDGRLKKALEIDPRFTNARVDLARVYIADARYTDARRELQQVVGETRPSVIADWTMKDAPRARKLLESIKDQK